MSSIGLDGRLILAGCGKMGSALLHGWLRGGVDPHLISVVEPDAGRAAMVPDGIECAHAVPELKHGILARVLILAVKPQMMADALPLYRKLLSKRSLVVSIAAGTAISTFEEAFGQEQPIIRIMPNTPASVGAGMSVLCANSHASVDDRHLATALMASVGATAWIEDEADMHAVTALSGSGPAYVFHLVECMAKAGEQLGLNADLAMQLARATVCGAGSLMDKDLSKAAELRSNVTSPGGTTQAALEVLMANGRMADLFEDALAAAARRSQELA